MIEYVVSIWFWAVGWRVGPPPCNGEYLVQHRDGGLRVAEFVRGIPDPDGGWSVIGPVACWRRIRGPIPTAPARSSTRC